MDRDYGLDLGGWFDIDLMWTVSPGWWEAFGKCGEHKSIYNLCGA